MIRVCCSNKTSKPYYVLINTHAHRPQAKRLNMRSLQHVLEERAKLRRIGKRRPRRREHDVGGVEEHELRGGALAQPRQAQLPAACAAARARAAAARCARRAATARSAGGAAAIGAADLVARALAPRDERLHELRALVVREQAQALCW